MTRHVGSTPTITDVYLRNLKDLGADDDVIAAAERAAQTIASRDRSTREGVKKVARLRGKRSS